MHSLFFIIEGERHGKPELPGEGLYLQAVPLLLYQSQAGGGGLPQLPQESRGSGSLRARQKAGERGGIHGRFFVGRHFCRLHLVRFFKEASSFFLHLPPSLLILIKK